MLTSPIALYQMASLSLAILATAMAVCLLLTRRHVIIKPTFFVAAFATLQSWSSAGYAVEAYRFLPSPWPFLAVTQVVPIMLLLISAFSAERSAREIWNLVGIVPAHRYLALRRVVVALLVISAACLAVYFAYVPPWRTGLWVALAHGDILLSRDAREESLKLLPAIPRYVFSFNREVVSRFAVAALALIAVAIWRVRGQSVFIAIPALVLVLALVLVWALSASLYGARGPAGLVVATFVLAFYLYKRAPLKVSYVVIGFAAVLVLPTFLSLMRIGGELSLGGMWAEFTERILYRVFATNAQVAIWHMDYVQRHGFWGVAGISKLAPWFNVQPVNVDNLIMNVYHTTSPTALATVGSFVTNYTRWGLLGGMLVSVATVWLLDGLLALFRRLTPALILPALCMFLMAARGVVGSNVETVLITRGLVPGLALVWLLNAMFRRRRQVGRQLLRGQAGDGPAREWGLSVPVRVRRRRGWLAPGLRGSIRDSPPHGRR
jgi:hypothetical protein